MNCPCQFSKGAGLDSVLAFLEVSYRTLGNTGLAREELGRKLLGSCSNFFQVFRIRYSLVFPKRPFHWIQSSSFRHHGQVGPARPAGGCLFADVMKFACDDMPAYKQADGLARACAAVRSAKLAFGPRKKSFDF